MSGFVAPARIGSVINCRLLSHGTRLCSSSVIQIMPFLDASQTRVVYYIIHRCGLFMRALLANIMGKLQVYSEVVCAGLSLTARL